MSIATGIQIVLSNSVTPSRRSKRKGIPVKSPSHFDLDTSPGVIFKFPIYFPSTPIKLSPLSPVESSISSSSSLEDDEVTEKSDGSIILHYPVLLSHVARKRRAKSLDSVLPKTSPTKNGLSNTTKPRRSSAQWAQSSSMDLGSHEEKIHNEAEAAHSHELSSSKRSPSGSPGAANPKKCCASCAVKHTPCWRPGWSEHIPLCNSCGLRYRKTKIYCHNCLYIPLRTELNSSSECRKCFQKLH
ncbi:DNA-binding transcription repressor [Basidiobolus ranarum]|uniref:DNA-binding transcription repressor n=1 Tax=Basidiobolus ranarum TaxID=34480 RepID=A0ABR2W0L9_9FUNG